MFSRNRKIGARAFRITESDVKGYGYAKPRGMRKNPGVTAIAAINGRGAYPGRSARKAMTGLSLNERRARARVLTSGERSAFAGRMQSAKRESSGMRRNRKAPSAKQLAARARFAAMAKARAAARGGGSKGSGLAKNRRRGLRRNRRRPLLARGLRRNAGRTGAAMRRRAKSKTRVTKRRRRRVAGKRPVTRRRKRRLVANRSVKRTRKRRRKSAKRPVRRVRRKRRTRSSARRTTRRRRRKLVANKKTRRTRRRRRSAAKRPVKRVRRRRRAKRHVANRRRRSSRRRKHTANRRTRRVRKNRSSGRRRRHVRNRRSGRRRHRRNYRRNRGFFGRMFKKNPGSIVMMGVIGFGGFALAKFAGSLLAKGIARVTAGPSTPAIAPAAGFGSIEAMSQPLGAVVAAVIGVPLVMKFVSDPDTKQALVLGISMSALHSLAVAALGAIHPGARAVLSGDDTAVKLAAMYGMGGGTSIMPHYAPVNGMGEYIGPTAGLGEYFESGVEGLGNYVGNADLYQAAAGYGAAETSNTNHIDPGGDLDRELTIAEAAAGVGSIQQAAAGLPSYAAQAGYRGYGEYFDSSMNGLGNVGVLPSSSTWIPGSSYPQLWAGTRPVNETQEATAMVPAGVLSSPGSQGVFGG